ncbi:MAG: alpha/beta hydrolase [Clostridia bacterium]|nr:MAG: alpha/beta hydrolase [Clostridia bacterium]
MPNPKEKYVTNPESDPAGQRVEFYNQEGEKLVGVWHRPQGQPGRPVIVFSHGFRGNKEGVNGQAVALADKLCQDGYPVLRFDYHGIGESEGNFKDVTLTKCCQDLSSALDLVSELVLGNQVIVAGHSFGGVVAVTLAARDPRITGMILVSTPKDQEQSFAYVFGEEAAAKLNQGLTVTLRDFQGEYQLSPAVVADMKAYDLLADIARIPPRPILFIYGDQDNMARTCQAPALVAAAGQPKELVVIEEGNHFLMGQVPKVHQAITAWLAHHFNRR